MNITKKQSKKKLKDKKRLIGKVNTQVVTIDKVKVNALLDTGSVISCVSDDFYSKSLSAFPLQSVQSLFTDDIQISSATGTPLNIIGYIEVDILFPGLIHPTPVLVTVLKTSILDDKMPALLGVNALEEWKLALQQQYPPNKIPKINSIIDKWKPEQDSTIGIVQVDKRLSRDNNQMCNLFSANIQVKDTKPYDRRVVFSPFSRYKSSIPSTTVIIPKHHKSVTMKVPVFPTQKKTKHHVRSGIAIGTTASVSHTFNVPHTPLSDNKIINKEDFLKMFDQAWPSEYKHDIEDLLWKHRHVFALSHNDLGKCDVTDHHIELEDKTPIRGKYRRIPPHHYDAVKLEIEKLAEAGVIEPSNSPWSSPISIAVKKDNSIRICLDFRKINSLTRKDAKSIPNIEEMFDTLSGKRIFSSLDLLQGFHQIPLSNSCKEYTAFTAGNLGFYQYTRMPFGLCNATATFQRTMETVLQDLLRAICLVYIDDVVVYSDTAYEHLKNLDIVFNRLHQHGLRLKPSKCVLFRNKLNFLGHTISDEGISKDQSKVEAIKVWKEPTSVRELRSFMGLTGFLRRFIAGYATIAQPLTDLLSGYSNKKGSKQQNKKLEKTQWHWGKQQQHAFDILKKKISEDVTLAYADFSKKFRLSTDASRTGLGAVLEQQHESGWRPVAFASRRTTGAERNYATHKLEFLALRWAICDKFKDYLSGTEFEVFTDNNPLTHVWANAKLDATAQRWVASLESFNFKVFYRPGKNNVVADSLSRLYSNEPDDTTQYQTWAKQKCYGFPASDESHNSIVASMVGNFVDLHKVRDFDWIQLQGADQEIQTIIQFVKQKKKPNPDALQNLSPDCISLLRHFKNLQVVKNLLCYIQEQDRKLVVPTSQRAEVTKLYHSFGHFGVTRTVKLIQERFFWPHIKETVTTVCSTCERCQKAKTPKQANKGPLQHMSTPPHPMHTISMDFLQIDTRTQTKFKVLTILDEFSKYGFALQVKSENAKLTAQTLYKNIYTKFGVPEVVHTDRGQTFLSNVLKQVNELLSIKHTVTTPYRPQSNGACERLNSTIIARIRTLPPSEKTKWHLHLDSLLLAYNSTVHESTQASPFYVMFGRRPKIPLDLMIRLPALQDNQLPVNVKNFASEREQELKASFELCAKNIEKRKERSKRNFDNKLGRPTLVFQPSDRVLVRKHSTKNKIDDRYQAEIHEVLSKKDKTPVYIVRGFESGVVKTFHRDNIILFKEAVAPVPKITLEDIPSWQQLQTKPFKPDEDDIEYSIRKQLNNKVCIFYGDSTPIQVDSNIIVQKDVKEDDLVNLLKSARDDTHHTALISVDNLNNNRNSLSTVLRCIRTCISHKDWIKIVISTKNHIIYNLLLQDMHTYFPKTVVVHKPVYVSESDDISDYSSDEDDYLFQRQHFPEPIHDNNSIADSSIENIVSSVPSDSTSDDDSSVPSDSTDDDSDDEDQPRYNLRTHGRRPSSRLRDHVLYTVLPL